MTISGLTTRFQPQSAWHLSLQCPPCVPTLAAAGYSSEDTGRPSSTQGPIVLMTSFWQWRGFGEGPGGRMGQDSTIHPTSLLGAMDPPGAAGSFSPEQAEPHSCGRDRPGQWEVLPGIMPLEWPG